MSPEPEEEEDEEIEIDFSQLFGDLLIESGVTSGSDPSAWDPVRIEREQGAEEREEVLDTSKLNGAKANDGATSGSDAGLTADDKPKEPKPQK